MLRRVLVAGLLLAGCSAPEASTSTVAPTGPITAVVARPDIVPITPAPQPKLPVTVTDNQGTKVTVTSVDRVLAFDTYGTLAATVFGLGLGDKVVGRDTSTGFPAAKNLPVITANGHQLNAEAIMTLRPSVVITDTTLGPWDVVLQLRDSGIPVVVTDSKRTIDNVNEIVGQVANALGVPEAGAQLVERTTKEIAEAKATVAKTQNQKPRIVFLYLRGQAGVYYMFGRGSGVDSLIEAVGGVDVATEAGMDGMRPINPEALVKARPDVILLMTKGLQSVGGVDGVLQLPGVAQTPAGQNRRIIDMDDHQILGFGPLTASVLDALAKALYGTAK
ncbi:heme/hemin ABC transporter substrate-binding protein [Kibdelosporangium aridum]|uniref:heme/hemin ABC transporter substrate-binding protein n=1 Tax=Kibdelosporangium aridum TaxID=2030 RepID=UPI001F1D180C|nr:ABC transporter substrate-binding protein [Kibdelosporangium aridum]